MLCYLCARSAAGATAFAPSGVLPRAANNGAQGLCMNAGGGKIKSVAAFRRGTGRGGGAPVDPSSIDLDLVRGTKPVKDTVGGVDATYAKPLSSFFSFGGSVLYVWVCVICDGVTSVCTHGHTPLLVQICRRSELLAFLEVRRRNLTVHPYCYMSLKILTVLYQLISIDRIQ